MCNELRKEETQAVPFYIAYLDGLVMVQLSIMEQQFLSPNFAKRAILEMAFRKIVAVAKKAAKKSQSAKIMGTAAAVGMFLMMFSEVFSVFTPKKAKTEAKGVQTESPSKMGTHQG